MTEEKMTEEKVEKNPENTGEAEKTKDDSKKENVEKPKRKGRYEKTRKDVEDDIAGWEPKTSLGKNVKDNKITSIDYILDNNMKILEEQIVDKLLELDSELAAIGQSKGKFGGGKRRAWKQTQRKTKEGNVPTFAAMAIVGDKNGHVGVGKGRSSETLPARDKATKKAKKNIIKVNRKCSAFDCDCNELHTIPYKVTGKAGSVKIELIPAPQGTGLVVGDEIKKVLELAGIKDVYSKTFGQTKITFNFVNACMDALKKTNEKGVEIK